MTIKQVKKIIDFVTNKYQLGYMSGDEFNDIFRLAEISHQSFLIGNLHQYAPGRPVPRVALDQTKQVVERLSPFRYTYNATVPVNNEVSKDSTMAGVEAVNKSDGTRVYFVSPHRLSWYLNSSVWNLADNPIYVEYDTYYKVFPASISVVFTGIKTPPISKWAYSVVDEVEIYNNISSTDPIWKDVDVVEIIGRMCKHIGVSLKDGELMNYAQSVINNGE